MKAFSALAHVRRRAEFTGYGCLCFFFGVGIPTGILIWMVGTGEDADSTRMKSRVQGPVDLIK